MQELRWQLREFSRSIVDKSDFRQSIRFFQNDFRASSENFPFHHPSVPIYAIPAER